MWTRNKAVTHSRTLFILEFVDVAEYSRCVAGYRELSSPAFIPIHPPTSVHVPCDCHLARPPPTSPTHTDAAHSLSHSPGAKLHDQRLNGVIRQCVHQGVNGYVGVVPPGWAGHSYTLPYVHHTSPPRQPCIQTPLSPQQQQQHQSHIKQQHTRNRKHPQNVYRNPTSPNNKV